MRTVLCLHLGGVDDIASTRCGALEKFVNYRLVWFRSFRGKAAETSQQRRGDADGDELFGVTRLGSADAACAPEFRVRGLRNVGEINAAIRSMPDVLCRWLEAR
jgi:hypothetical protein